MPESHGAHADSPGSLSHHIDVDAARSQCQPEEQTATASLCRLHSEMAVRSAQASASAAAHASVVQPPPGHVSLVGKPLSFEEQCARRRDRFATPTAEEKHEGTWSLHTASAHDATGAALADVADACNRSREEAAQGPNALARAQAADGVTAATRMALEHAYDACVALRMIPTQTLVAALCQRLAPGASLRTVRIGQRAAALCESALVG